MTTEFPTSSAVPKTGDSTTCATRERSRDRSNKQHGVRGCLAVARRSCSPRHGARLLYTTVKIGVGTADWIRPPLPPNRTGGSPAYGSPVDGLPTGGLDETKMGCVQAVQPMLVEVGVRPTLLPPCTPVSSVSNMRSVHTHGFAQSLGEGGSPAGVAAKGTVTGS
jgi:hypothetical protein